MAMTQSFNNDQDAQSSETNHSSLKSPKTMLSTGAEKLAESRLPQKDLEENKYNNVFFISYSNEAFCEFFTKVFKRLYFSPKSPAQNERTNPQSLFNDAVNKAAGDGLIDCNGWKNLFGPI